MPELFIKRRFLPSALRLARRTSALGASTVGRAPVVRHGHHPRGSACVDSRSRRPVLAMWLGESLLREGRMFRRADQGPLPCGCTTTSPTAHQPCYLEDRIEYPAHGRFGSRRGRFRRRRLDRLFFYRHDLRPAISGSAAGGVGPTRQSINLPASIAEPSTSPPPVWHG